MIGVLTYSGTDYLVAVADNGATSYATLSISASIGQWSFGQVFPVGFASGTGYQIGDDLVFVSHSGTTVTLSTLAEPGGGWIVSGTIATSASSVLGVIGSSLITTSGAVIDATALSDQGLAPWSLSVPLAVSGSNVTLLAFDLGTQYAAFWIPTTSGQAGWKQQVYVPSWVSVPLPVALSAGATYHLVLSASNSLTTGTAVPVVTSSAPSGQVDDAGSWMPLGGSIPFLTLYGGGAPLAFIAVGKTTVLWFDPPSGILTSVVELVDDTSNSRVLTYTTNVLSEAN